MRRRVRLQRRRRRELGGVLASGAWKTPALIAGAAAVVGGAIWALTGRGSSTRKARARDPWDLDAPLSPATVIAGWGEPRTYRCKKDEQGKCLSIPLHEGLDFSGSSGTVVKAMADGVVTAVDLVPDSYPGRNITIDYGSGLSATYMHLAAVYPHVRVGARVGRGLPVATRGSSGIKGDGSVVPHLHVTFWMKDLALYEKLFGKPKSGWGMHSSHGYAVPGEPLVPAAYSRTTITRALDRGVAPPRQAA